MLLRCLCFEWNQQTGPKNRRLNDQLSDSLRISIQGVQNEHKDAHKKEGKFLVLMREISCLNIFPVSEIFFFTCPIVCSVHEPINLFFGVRVNNKVWFLAKVGLCMFSAHHNDV